MHVKYLLATIIGLAATSIGQADECLTANDTAIVIDSAVVPTPSPSSIVSTPVPVQGETPGLRTVQTPMPTPASSPDTIPSPAPTSIMTPATVVPADFTAMGVGESALKVMSFNLRTSNARDPCPAGCWAQRKARAQKLLQTHAPDFVGTQEGAPDQIADMQSFGYAMFGECAGPCAENERDGIFYRGDKWELVAGQTFALSDTPDVVPSNTWNLEYLRTGVLARFRSKAGAGTVCMLNTHYDISRGQEQSSVLVTERMASFCQPEDTVVMTGDLNTPPGTPAIQFLENKASIRGKTNQIPMYETLTAAGAGGPTWIGPSFGTQVVGSKIDYIFARRDTHTCLQRGEILTDAIDGYTSSDHAVVMSSFCMGASCSGCV